MASTIQSKNPHHHHLLLSISSSHYPFVSGTTSVSVPTKPSTKPKHLKLNSTLLSSSSSSGKNAHKICGENDKLTSETSNSASPKKMKKRKKRVFFLDVYPLCYKGRIPCLYSFAHWVSLFFSEVSLSDPVIAVISHSLPLSNFV